MINNLFFGYLRIQYSLIILALLSLYLIYFIINGYLEVVVFNLINEFFIDKENMLFYIYIFSISNKLSI
mgnify:CR=1 FL=1